MRIRGIRALDVPPVRNFEVTDLSDVVVISGPNGVGKTRLISAVLNHFRQPSAGQVGLVVEATDADERDAWGKGSLDTGDPADAQLLTAMLQQNKRRRNFRSSVLYYESDRSIQKIQPLQFQWEIDDPYKEQVSWDMTIGSLHDRFQDTLHAIFKKIQSQKSSIATRAVELKREGHTSMKLEFSDPLDPFRDAFRQLLGPKELDRAEMQTQTLMYRTNGQEFDITSLSSGEREVLNITFDFLLRQPSHCVTFLDEPELHLHPELSAKLISTLRAVGKHNQFILCSHSPDIISSSLDDSVVFLTPPKDDGSNQAVLVRADDETSEALSRLGHSIGVVSLGKRIVLVEGTRASLDKQTYTHLLKNRFPDLVLLPSGGKGTLRSFETIRRDVLGRAVWGVEFFMLADRDAVPADGNPQELESQSAGRFKCLRKYHLENYFLNPQVLAAVFEEMEPEGSWLRDPNRIDATLRELAQQFVGYATTLLVSKAVRESMGNVDIMAKDCHGKTEDEVQQLISSALEDERSRFQKALDANSVIQNVSDTYRRIETSLKGEGPNWHDDIPGKPLLASFAGKANINTGRLKSLYIAKEDTVTNSPFEEIIDVFAGFSALGAGGA